MPISFKRSYRAIANAISRGEGLESWKRAQAENARQDPSQKSGDLFRSLYPHHNVGAASDLLTTSNGSSFFDYELSTMVPTTFTPNVKTHHNALCIPTKAVFPNDWSRDGYFDHVAYDHQDNPIPEANHIIYRYKGYTQPQALPLRQGSTSGSHYHMGFLLTHYGHFILETLTRAWHVLQEGTDPKDTTFVFHLWQRDVAKANAGELQQKLFHGYWADYLNTLGITENNTMFITAPTSFDSITIPQCAVSLSAADCFGSRAAVEVWRFLNRQMSTRYFTQNTDANFGELLYISRRKVANPNRGRVYNNEAEIEELFRENGFVIVYPEDLQSEYEKQAILSKARIIAGAPGSGLLSSVFIPQKAHVFMIVSEQAYKTNPAVIHQISMDALVGHQTHVYYEHDLSLGTGPAQPPISLAKLETSLKVCLDICNQVDTSPELRN